VDEAKEQIEAALERIRAWLMMSHGADAEDVVRLVRTEMHPALVALHELADPELAHDAALTIAEVLFPAFDGVAPQIPPAWWETPLGRRVSDALGSHELPGALLTVEQAALELGVSRRTVQRWILAGRFAGVRSERYPGGVRWLIPASEVRRLR
jgi:excisionase family DNA binding protein